MTTTMWVLAGIGAWVLVGLAVALVFGRMIRLRDRGLPGPPDGDDGERAGHLPPRPRSAAEPPAPGGGQAPRP